AWRGRATTSSSSATRTSSGTSSCAAAAPTSTRGTACDAGCTPRSISRGASAGSSSSRTGRSRRTPKPTPAPGPRSLVVARFLAGPGRRLAHARAELLVRRALDGGDHAREVVLRDEALARAGQREPVLQQHRVRLDLERRHPVERYLAEALGHGQRE